MECDRQNPDRLLKAIRVKEEQELQRGSLKIFFGYAAGVGKTYAMLEAAHLKKQQGIDVVCGYIEPHPRPSTLSLLEGLEVLPGKTINHHGIEVKEFDLDGALQRKPQLILVDELAHTNAAGSRHHKRYQDIRELLAAGIDVYTTVNVQHIESINDQVAAITGIYVKERIPDSVFDGAAQVELVDIEPSELLKRIEAGQIYRKQQAIRAVNHFFTVEKLTALREIALRRCADRVNQLSESNRITSGGDFYTDDHILVCLSSAPSNARIIRTAARMATAFRSRFTALYVDAQDHRYQDKENQERLQANMRLASQLGARVETVEGEDIPFQIVEFARLSGVSKIVLGRSAMGSGRGFLKGSSMTDYIIANAPNLDVHIIPDSSGQNRSKANTHGRLLSAVKKEDCIQILLALGFSTCIGLGFQSMKWSKGGILPFVFVFLIVFIIIAFTLRLRKAARQAAKTAYRTALLFDTNQLLQNAETVEQIVNVTAQQLTKLLERDIIIYLFEGDTLSAPYSFGVDNRQVSQDCLGDNERTVALWCGKNQKKAGAFTDTLSSACCQYYSIKRNNEVFGVVGIHMEHKNLDSFQGSVLLSILGECALALKQQK